MAELVDWHAVLVTNPQELERARLSHVQTKTLAASFRARGALLKGSRRARDDFARRWAAVAPKASPADLLAKIPVYVGHGPPQEPWPDHIPVGSWYLDLDTEQLYRLEAGS